MTRDPRYNILFEPVKIGPKTAKNRFYQVPHCTGSGYRFPHTVAALRGMKAEGGWGVINTEWCSIHPSGDTTPTSSARLWTDEDVATNALMTDAVHEHDALAGCQFGHPGLYSHNRYSRLPTIGPSPRPLTIQDFPAQGRAMDRDDIRNVLRWHRNATRRAIEAGFDIVYLYAGHGMTIFTDFLSPRINQRTDEYGGSLENRARLLREAFDEVHDEAAGRCAVAIRFCVDERTGPGCIGPEEGRAVVEMMAEVPDLWDVTVEAYNDILGSRYRKEGWQESGIDFVKQVTTKPVVGVGRFTSPDTMVSMVKRGVLDLIGAARPSIADPFIPKKIEEGRPEDIRECIGCNVCLASNSLTVPIRCSQNPTISEEWRRGWHPEQIPTKGSNGRVLVIGAGPAGLEAARAAGDRGYQVTLAEAGRDLGGHLNRFTRMPGFSEWARVRDWRVGQIEKMNNVAVFLESNLGAEDVTEFGVEHLIVATGSHWRRDGVGLVHFHPVDGHDRGHVLTPDDVLSGAEIRSPVVIYDDDSYVTGAALDYRRIY
ncbi:MAG: FAD-dependent oxidoreductase [Rhodospirillaceae bacterium]|nr:FAD-dependent oxidoreductase [Rhodospirillaceae bacterium]